MSDYKYIIVQAGGKGTRMKELTRNKPKALVPVNNLPMIFHLFRKFPHKKFIIIGDYKYDVLVKYLAAFVSVDYTVVNGSGATGTCSGLQEALKLVEDESPFMLIWSDLVLPDSFRMPKSIANYIGVSKDFRCRWSWKNNRFVEEPSKEYGVAGCFLFENKKLLGNVPTEGEFVRYLAGRNIEFNELPLYGTHEYGLIEEYAKLPKCRCRPFNSLEVKGDTIIKTGIDEQGKVLAVRERLWYQKIMDAGFTSIPKIYQMEPLVMERINGMNIYEYYDLSPEQRKKILKSLIDCLKSIHSIESVPSDFQSYEEAYIGKTIKRLEKVRDLVPFANDPYIVINGKECRNVFFHWDEIREKIRKYFPDKFVLLHGDCTFSNLMLRNKDMSPILIDPRGYFGTTELYGDPAYEWAKLYYSIVGNYDRFNLKRFDLSINQDDVKLSIESNGWEDTEDYFFEILEDEIDPYQIKLIHAIIWLSLTTYAWEDYDSICGAFYNGIYYLEEVL